MPLARFPFAKDCCGICPPVPSLPLLAPALSIAKQMLQRPLGPFSAVRGSSSLNSRQHVCFRTVECAGRAYARVFNAPARADFRLEFLMSQKIPGSSPAALPGRAANPVKSKPQVAPTALKDPNEDLGRHKNTGQKDHQGAR